VYKSNRVADPRQIRERVVIAAGKRVAIVTVYRKDAPKGVGGSRVPVLYRVTLYPSYDRSS
jgi:hypothetical protein